MAPDCLSLIVHHALRVSLSSTQTGVKRRLRHLAEDQAKITARATEADLTDAAQSERCRRDWGEGGGIG